ncbi:isoleucine--tRNA ligase [Patescibacteria group bacterium]|nr:isoleucine--tRNA ligase [Patescibacteria group bacterium]MBU1721317.1 isoleucine--tRNA ligase [Patescibacteria group bacterium]MBU1900957.1 isoleucine--tRNA ligase [Patescibacteria group bacterium]
MPYNANEQEQKIMEFWRQNKTFEKSVNERSENKPYVFYDGPPFATGLPHYGHILASAMKDLVPRFWTMKGYRVERKWGWDCHGLPIENIVEKELNLGSKQDIENYGIANFNEACRGMVLTYAEEWKKTIERMGRWVDMENDYKTMDLPFMESVWWVFKELWEKGYVYEGKKAMHICPRCVTPLSNFEVTQGYKDIKDISATAQFKVLEGKEKFDVEGDLYILAWTTTPWTLPGNVLLAVGEDIEYSLVKFEGNTFVVAKDLLMKNFEEKEFEVLSQVKGSDFVGLTYEPLFPYFAETKNAFRVVAADFVTTEDGTGIVHIAPAFGEDDYRLGREEDVDFVQHVDMEGKFTSAVIDFAGVEVKNKEDHMATDIEIIRYLAQNGKLFSKKKYEHSYPHCWRCDTPLLNYATSSWFVEVTKIKEELLENNKKINWVPDHIKDGRFGLWLEGARDWAVSRTRYWGTPLPIWKSDDGDTICIGSAEELSELSGKEVKDLHKHFIDDIEITKDGKVYKRITEVFDCWFESGSMPYGQMHYPFENKEKFESGFPAEFIAEGQDQTRGWFYTLHVLATALTLGEESSIPKECSPAFKNVIVNGIVQAEDGKKMSKKLKNYPAPELIFEKYGADAMRYYLMASPVVHAEALAFSEVGVREVYNKLVNTLVNVLNFYEMFAVSRDTRQVTYTNLKSENVLDKWILAKLQNLVEEVTVNMEEYKLAEAARPIMEFVTELSQWYIRRSRERFKSGSEEDKSAALATLREVLLTLSKVMAPFTPFISEHVYQEVSGQSEKSVHLEMWPELNEELKNPESLETMESVRKLVELGLSLRKEVGIRVRQPLLALGVNKELEEGYKVIIAEEMNVKEVVSLSDASEWMKKEDKGLEVALNTEITEELKKEGLLREVVRAVNQMRKEKGFTREDRVVVHYKVEDELLSSVFSDYAEEIKSSVLADSLDVGEGEEAKVGDVMMQLQVEKK